MLLQLSEWPGSDFLDWIATEAAKRYGIPAEHVTEWLDAGRLTLLLDGLDELAAGRRPDCVRAIDGLPWKDGRLQLALCSRSSEYAELCGRSAIRGRVQIDPLTAEAVDDFLHDHGLDGARAVLAADRSLRELVTTPLLLAACGWWWAGWWGVGLAVLVGLMSLVPHPASIDLARLTNSPTVHLADHGTR